MRSSTIVLDWYTKKIVGHYSGTRATSSEWLEALEKGLNKEFPGGVRSHGLKLMSDNGSQATSLSFRKPVSIWKYIRYRLVTITQKGMQIQKE